MTYHRNWNENRCPSECPYKCLKAESRCLLNETWCGAANRRSFIAASSKRRTETRRTMKTGASGQSIVLPPNNCSRERTSLANKSLPTSAAERYTNNTGVWLFCAYKIGEALSCYKLLDVLSSLSKGTPGHA